MVVTILLSDYHKIVLRKYKQSLCSISTARLKNMAIMDSSRRVISCLVNEHLVKSSLIKIIGKNNEYYQADDSFWLVLHNNSDLQSKIWVPIIHNITEKNINFDIEKGIVHFLDPNDLGLVVLLSDSGKQSPQCELVTEIEQIFEMVIDLGNSGAIAAMVNEINNSIQHQVVAYEKSASFIPLWSHPIEYEQAITVGHATHPMNKSRVPMHQMKVDTTLYNFKKIKVYFLKVPKSSMNIYGNYEKVMRAVAKKLNISFDPDTEVIVPVHELQKDVVNNLFDTLQLHESKSTGALSQCSLRTVDINEISEYSFKLSLGMLITSAMRTITHWSAYHGHFMEEVIQKMVGTNKYLTVLNELGSIIVKNDDFNISKHFACIIRENVSVKLSNYPSETAIVCAYLTEMSNEEYNITELFDLTSQKDKENFSDAYAKLLIDSLFHFVYEFGFSFEAHQQNVLLRVKKNTESGLEMTGFIVRDFGGIIVHQETLQSKIGMTVTVLDENASILAKNLEDVYTLCYHTLFHCHLRQIFRSLGTHDNGWGWKFVREHLNTKKEFLANERCAKFFLGKWAPYKCFMKMKMNDLERNYLYTDVPNVINFCQI